MGKSEINHDCQVNIIERDMRYISWTLLWIMAVFVIGVLLGMVLDPFLNASGSHRGLSIGMQVVVAGVVLGLLPMLLFLVMLFVDTWKVEATPELREKYGHSIKWAILFFTLVSSPTPTWPLLLIGYFAYLGRYNEYMKGS